MGLTCRQLEPNAPRCPTFYTHDGRPSVLDYLLVNQNIAGDVQSYTTLERGDNMSDHLPVKSNLSIVIPSTQDTDVFGEQQMRPNWSRATPENIAEYKHKLDVYLQQTDISNGAIVCEVQNCTEHHAAFERFHNDIINACEHATDETIPRPPPRGRNTEV